MGANLKLAMLEDFKEKFEASEGIVRFYLWRTMHFPSRDGSYELAVRSIVERFNYLCFPVKERS